MRLSWTFVGGITFAAGLATCTVAAEAAERVYYRETPWELSLVVDDAGVQNPFCALRTTTWQNQQVSLEFTLTGLDTVGEYFRLRKKGWNLPAGAATEVGLKNNLSSDQFDSIRFDVVSGDDLYAAFEPQTDQGKFALLLAFGFAPGKLTPAQAIFRFKGNEPEWAVPAASPVDFPSLGRAYLECRTELLKLGHQRFSSSESTSTSPFADTSENKNGEGIAGYDAVERVPMTMEEFSAHSGAPSEFASPQKWDFNIRNDPDSQTCVIQTETNGLTIGFEAWSEPGIVAFITGMKISTGTVRWRPDVLRAYEVQDTSDDAYNMLRFSLPNSDLVTDLAASSALSVTVVGKGVQILDVSASRAAFREFIDCPKTLNAVE